ncbi:MAG: hypothetical protein ACKPKO_19425 [Candidatus Fonsibacter sp.]
MINSRLPSTTIANYYTKAEFQQMLFKPNRQRSSIIRHLKQTS